MHKTRIAGSLLIMLLFAASTAADFVQPVNLNWSRGNGGGGQINTPAALVGNVTSETDAHPDPQGGGGGTSWYDPSWSGHSLTFDFTTSSKLASFHLWDYYLHTNDVFRLTLYDATGGTGIKLYEVDHTIVPGPSGGGSKRHDISFASVILGVQSGRITPLTDFSGSFAGFGLAEIGFVTAVPEAGALLSVGLVGGIAGLALLSKKKLRTVGP